MNFFEMFAQDNRNLKALDSFQRIFQFKKQAEQALGRKLTWDQLGEIVDMLTKFHDVDKMTPVLQKILTS